MQKVKGKLAFFVQKVGEETFGRHISHFGETKYQLKGTSKLIPICIFKFPNIHIQYVEENIIDAMEPETL